MKVALVHDWLITYRGGERVLEVIAELFPDAPIFTLFHKPGSQSPALEARRIVTSFLDRLPQARDRHRIFFPAMPAAIRALDLSGFDLVVSSSTCVAKGARPARGAVHVAYVNAPMRYMWDRFDDYFGPGRASLPIRAAATALRPWLQRWDRTSSAGIDRIIANSRNVAEKISRFWGRESEVIHPPVELDRFIGTPLEGGGRGGYFLWLGALAPYKRLDLALAAFRDVGAPLWVAGSGQEKVADLPPNVKLLGQVSDGDVPELLRGARALVFPGEEDFGITPLEAQACGRPVIAYARGGVLETTNERTALYFREQTPSALAGAVRSFDAFEARFDPAEARRNAQRFSRAAFQAAFRRVVDEAVGRPVCAGAPLV